MKTFDKIGIAVLSAIVGAGLMLFLGLALSAPKPSTCTWEACCCAVETECR